MVGYNGKVMYGFMMPSGAFLEDVLGFDLSRVSKDIRVVNITSHGLEMCFIGVLVEPFTTIEDITTGDRSIIPVVDETTLDRMAEKLASGLYGKIGVCASLSTKMLVEFDQTNTLTYAKPL